MSCCSQSQASYLASCSFTGVLPDGRPEPFSPKIAAQKERRSHLADRRRPTEMDLIDDDTLARTVSSARGGNRAALEAVVRAIEPYVSRLALRFFGCPH